MAEPKSTDRTERQRLLISLSLMTGLAPSTCQCFPSVKFDRLDFPSKHYDWSVSRATNKADQQTDRQTESAASVCLKRVLS